jgi:hypothetical protein
MVGARGGRGGGGARRGFDCAYIENVIFSPLNYKIFGRISSAVRPMNCSVSSFSNEASDEQLVTGDFPSISSNGVFAWSQVREMLHVRHVWQIKEIRLQLVLSLPRESRLEAGAMLCSATATALTLSTLTITLHPHPPSLALTTSPPQPPRHTRRAAE